MELAGLDTKPTNKSKNALCSVLNTGTIADIAAELFNGYAAVLLSMKLADERNKNDPPV